MAKVANEKGHKIYTITSPDGHTRASFVPEKGGVGYSLIMPSASGEREVLFLHEHCWERGRFDLPGGLPFLFPVCGRLKRMGVKGHYLYDGNVYNMPIHGFSSYVEWHVVDDKADDRLVMELVETKDTMAMYPFAFKIQLIYQVKNGCLICEQTYTNTGDNPMPYYAGFHPYFLTPAAGEGKGDVMLDFSPVRMFRYNEKRTDLVGEKKVISLPISIADCNINEQLTEVSADNVVKLKYPDGFQLFMKAKGVKKENMFKYIQTYTMPQKPFFCVEPWMGFPNALNTVQGVRWLSPGHSEKGLFFLSSVCDSDTCCVV